MGVALPDDPLITQQWDMNHITVPAAWAGGFTGSTDIRVCMIDTGLDYTHPDLVGNLWINPTEAAGAGATAGNNYKNGIDDDGDGKSSTPLSRVSRPSCVGCCGVVEVLSWHT